MEYRWYYWESRYAFIWNEADGTTYLPANGSDTCNWATAVSADGSVVAGYSSVCEIEPYIETEAFIWTEAEGTIGLGVPRGYAGSEARDISADGKVVVGDCTNADGDKWTAFRWTADQGMRLLSCKNLGLEVKSRAYGASKDGGIIVGYASTPLGGGAAIWIDDEVYLLKTLLLRMRLPVADWSLSEATAVSDDGRTIVGDGTNPDGETEAWVLQLERGESFPLTDRIPFEPRDLRRLRLPAGM
jgi:probable HAF family extracellular repeat protein